MNIRTRKKKENVVASCFCFSTLFFVAIYCFVFKDFFLELISSSWKEKKENSESTTQRQNLRVVEVVDYIKHEENTFVKEWTFLDTRKLIEWPSPVDLQLQPPKVLEDPPEPIDYPNYRKLYEIVNTWNPDEPEPPSNFKETIQHFNYSNPLERKMAAQYRDAEVPFKIYNVPEFDTVTQKWTDEYLQESFKTMDDFHVEKSETNHFMVFIRFSMIF